MMMACLVQADKKDEPMPDATASQEGAPAENGAADGAAAEHSAAPAAESADAATPMETETKGGAEVVKKKRTRKHAVPYKAQGVAGLSDKTVQVSSELAHAWGLSCLRIAVQSQSERATHDTSHTCGFFSYRLIAILLI